MSTIKRKEKINILGKEYKVAKPISDTLKSLADALHAHEVALLTWVHKDYSGKTKKKKDITSFRESLNDYCMNIPEAKNILKRMQEIDDQIEEDIKNKNKKEKEKGAKE